MLPNTVSESDSIILKKDTNLKVFKIIKNKPVSFCKEKFQLNNLIGQIYGSCFKVERGQLIKLDNEELRLLTEKCGKEEEESDKSSVAEVADVDDKNVVDNRDLIDKRENQKLTKEEIQKLRKDGVSGNEIVGQLIENSSTFNQKTEFSKEKYIKKKTKKHLTVFTLLRSNTRNLLSMYHFKGPTKICNLRMDSLAQILTYANVRAGGRYLVIDGCCGLVLGSVIERMNGEGLLINFYTGSASSRPAVDLGHNFTERQKNVLHDYPIDKISSLEDDDEGGDVTNVENAEVRNDSEKVGDVAMETTNNINSADDVVECEEDSDDDDDDCDDDDDGSRSDKDLDDGLTKSGENNKRKRSKDKEERDRRRLAKRQRISLTRTLIQEGQMDGLIVAAKVHPTPLVEKLLKFVLPSRPVVIFSSHSEPLVDCYSYLKDRGDILMLKLSETWLRSFQILPERSHPHVNMNGSGGFLLTGLTVDND